MNEKRQKLIKKLEKMTDCDVYVLFTASGEMQYAINGSFLPIYTRAVFSRRKKRRENAIVILETDGGSGPAVMSVVLQLRECYNKVYGYIFNRCYSAGTVGILATDEIFMSKYAFMGPIDTQFYVNNEGASIKPLIANFHAFNSRVPDVRESEFAKMYPDEYLMAITDLNYDFQVIFPNFVKHFDMPEELKEAELKEGEENAEQSEISEAAEEFEDMIVQAWDYFDGGVGEHSANINRTKARELGMRIHDIPDDVEEILFDIIDSYVSDTNMMIDSVSILEEKDAYFETVGASYVHYYLYDKIQHELKSKSDTSKSESDEPKSESDKPKNESDKPKTEPDAPKVTNKKNIIVDKYCTECGWRQE